MSKTLTYELADNTDEPEHIISDMEREARIFMHYGVTAVSATCSPLENKIYHIEDLTEPVYND